MQLDPGPRCRVGGVESGIETEASGPELAMFCCGLNEVGLGFISWADERGAREGRKGLVGAEFQSLPPRQLPVRRDVAGKVRRIVAPICRCAGIRRVQR